MELQKKISMVRVVGFKMSSAAIIKKGKDNRLFCGTFMGCASGIKTGVSDYGNWECLTGIFRAVNAEGEVFEAGNMFMPAVAHDMVTGKLRSGAVNVDFAFKLFSVIDDNSPVGFSYRAEPLLNTADNPLDRIAGLLAAPKPEGDTAKSKPETPKKESKPETPKVNK